VVGGGLVGLASAYALLKAHPVASLVLLEKEPQVAAHQSGRNSGVLHSGIYYAPGSLKANLTAQGRKAMLEFCQRFGIAHDVCGKVILATTEEEIPRLEPLYQRGRDNQLNVKLIDAGELAQIEPEARAQKAIWVPETGIVDYRAVASRLADELKRMGAELRTGVQWLGGEVRGKDVYLQTSGGDIQARLAVNCAGLYSDRLARATGVDPGLKIVPFRGEYFVLKLEARKFVRGLIYPLADPRFPFLGVHLTRMTDGNVLAGPNAVFSLKREGYAGGDFDAGDTWESLTYSGFWRLVLPNVGAGLGEMLRAWNVGAFAAAFQKLVPRLRAEHLEPTRAGVRAQAVDANGKLVDDFRFGRSEGWLHVLNAPSPAATASLAIGETIAIQAAEMMA
jgi:L-2-hydroxyglutarate oxidase